MINGVETFVSKDGCQSNPVINPCFDHLASHNCRPVEIDWSNVSEIPLAYQAKLDEIEAARLSYLNSDEYKMVQEKHIRAKEMEKEKIESEYNELLSANEVIPATVTNLCIILRYLNTVNWGVWRLPQMSISYSANQYDCDGVQATTITLDQPISDEDYGIKGKQKFMVGGKSGHLKNYQRLR
ncbi:MAG: hypothetical protein ABJH04_07480 [Cyclobacteriaceae bacterium]